METMSCLVNVFATIEEIPLDADDGKQAKISLRNQIKDIVGSHYKAKGRNRCKAKQLGCGPAENRHKLELPINDELFSV